MAQMLLPVTYHRLPDLVQQRIKSLLQTEAFLFLLRLPQRIAKTVLFPCICSCTLQTSHRQPACRLKNAPNTLKCGFQHSDAAVVGRKSGPPETPDDDNCTKARFPDSEKRAFAGDSLIRNQFRKSTFPVSTSCIAPITLIWPLSTISFSTGLLSRIVFTVMRTLVSAAASTK